MSDSHLIGRGTSLGRYIVVRHLGTGGQGVVYAAFDPELERNVALKLLRPDVGAGDADHRRTRMLREAQEHARLQHPNVVQILHVGTFFDQLYLAMANLSGGTLKDWLGKGQPRQQIIARFVEAGRGLAAAHELGRVHRDFKPDNVMLDERGVAHVADFGLAQRGEATGGAGTTRYMAPEQQARGQVGPAADQYSFCVALCEAVTGQLPSVENGVVKLPPAPNWLRSLLQQGLCPKPADRFPSMDALLSALETGPEARRRLVLRSAQLMLLLSFVGAIGWLLTRETDAERLRRECLTRARTTGDEMWSPERQAASGKRFTDVAGQVGSGTFGKVSELLGPEMQAWTDASRLSCFEPVSAAQASCLESRGRVLQSISRLFVLADASVVASAWNVVQLEVLPVATCFTTTTAAARVSPETDADQRVRPLLARVRVLKTAGQYDEALVAAMAIVAQAHGEDAPRVEAEAQLLVGQLSNQLHRPDTEAALTQAVRLAEQASADEERVRAWLVLISWYASHDDFESSTRAIDQADAILDRLGRPDHLEAQYQSQRGQLLDKQGDKTGASAAFKTSLDLLRKHFPENHPQVMKALMNYANSLPSSEEARPLLEQVLAMRAATFGEQHPETANAAHNLGIVLEGKAALVPLRRALEIWENQKPPDTCRLAREHFALARTHFAIGEAERAVEEQRRGLNLILHTGCPGMSDLGQELGWFRTLVATADQKPVDELLARLKNKETLPDVLPPPRGP